MSMFDINIYCKNDYYRYMCFIQNLISFINLVDNEQEILFMFKLINFTVGEMIIGAPFKQRTPYIEILTVL